MTHGPSVVVDILWLEKKHYTEHRIGQEVRKLGVDRVQARKRDVVQQLQQVKD